MKYGFLYKVFNRTVGSRCCMVMLMACLLMLHTATLHAQDDYEETDTTSVTEMPAQEDHVSYEERQHIAEPLSLRSVPDSVTSRLKRQKDFAYANDPAYWVREPEEEEGSGNGFLYSFYSLFSNQGFRTLVICLLIALFVFIIYRVMVVNNLYLFYRSKKAGHSTGDDEGDIEDDNLDDKIIRAIDQQDHRLAVRFMYLKALRLLNDRQWIRYNAQATNYDYVMQMNGHKKADEFRFLTRIYDYVWYGEFTLTGEQFKVVHNNFLNFYNAVI